MPLFAQVRLARLFGIPIKLDLSWFIIFVLVAWTLVVGYFPAMYPQLSSGQLWIMGIVGSLLLFASVLVHELCHCYVARRYGIPIRGVTLFIFGGVAEMGQEPANPKSEFLMAGAGPVSSIAIAILAGFAAKAAHSLELGPVVFGILQYVAFVNTALAIFNLIPGFPMDGGRLFRAFLWKVTGDLRRATRVASVVGSGFGGGLILLGFFQILLGQFLGGLWLVLIGFFLRTAAQGSYRQLVLRRALQGVTVNEIMTHDVVTVSPELLVSDLVHEYFIRRRYHSFPVIQGDQLVGVVSLEEVKHVPKDKWDTTSVAQIMNTKIVSLAVSPHDSALKTLTRMTTNGVGRLPVTEEGDLVGIVTQDDIVRFLNIMSDLGGETR